MDYKSFKQLNLALIINYSFDKNTIIIVKWSIIFSFYWVWVISPYVLIFEQCEQNLYFKVLQVGGKGKKPYTNCEFDVQTYTHSPVDAEGSLHIGYLFIIQQHPKRGPQHSASTIEYSQGDIS